MKKMEVDLRERNARKERGREGKSKLRKRERTRRRNVKEQKKVYIHQLPFPLFL